MPLMSFKLLQKSWTYYFHLHQVLELLLTQQGILPGIFSCMLPTLMQPLLHHLAPNVMSWTLLRKVKEIVCNTNLVACNLELVEVEVFSKNFFDKLSIFYH